MKPLILILPQKFVPMAKPQVSYYCTTAREKHDVRRLPTGTDLDHPRPGSSGARSPIDRSLNPYINQPSNIVPVQQPSPSSQFPPTHHHEVHALQHPRHSLSCILYDPRPPECFSRCFCPRNTLAGGRRRLDYWRNSMRLMVGLGFSIHNCLLNLRRNVTNPPDQITNRNGRVLLRKGDRITNSMQPTAFRSCEENSFDF